MFRRDPIAISPIKGTYTNSYKTQSKSNYHEWIKFFLSALIPLMIGVFTIVTTMLQQKLSDQQREQDKEDARLFRLQSDHQTDILRQETVFDTYIDDISAILMENEVQHLVHIRIKTLTSLRQLDPERKQHLLLFLYESGLIYHHSTKPISSLLRVNYVNFNDIFFKGTMENQCSFLRLYLHEAYLSNSSFIDCYIDRGNFSNAIMYKATFFNTLLIRSSFKFASLVKANFNKSKLAGIDFSGASLVESIFTGTLWKERNVNFTNANLTGAIISNEQLHNSTLYNCILPNGTWGLIYTKNLVVNGDVEQNCTANGSNFSSGWDVSNTGEIKVFAYSTRNLTKTLGECYFRVTLFYNSRKVVYAVQTITLERFSLLISTGLARYHASADIQCFGSQYVIIELYFIDFNGLRYPVVSSGSVSGTEMESIEMSDIVPLDVRSVRMFITFITGFDLLNLRIKYSINIEPSVLHIDCHEHSLECVEIIFINNGLSSLSGYAYELLSMNWSELLNIQLFD
ncbi:unnamed protein product [Rotaria sordida]|uniref:Pentapeptide repeat-containing protein n=1 Tax=Rotaria sordida TaxID=392033 RepID=A0A819SKJ2_9BILA|nr:unnamed protein product [Rotaria sordida]